MTKNNYFLKEKYEQLKKLNILKNYTISIKEQFLTEELWKSMINGFNKDIELLKQQIKQIQG